MYISDSRSVLMLPAPAAGGVSLASAEHIRQSQGMMNILRIVLSQQTANNIHTKDGYNFKSKVLSQLITPVFSPHVPALSILILCTVEAASVRRPAVWAGALSLSAELSTDVIKIMMANE